MFSKVHSAGKHSKRIGLIFICVPAIRGEISLTFENFVLREMSGFEKVTSSSTGHFFLPEKQGKRLRDRVTDG